MVTVHALINVTVFLVYLDKVASLKITNKGGDNMARGEKNPNQVSMDDLPEKKSKRGFFSFLKSKGTVVKAESNSDKTVFAVDDKKYTVETSHGRFKRFKAELKEGKNSITQKPLSDTDIAFRKGVIRTMGEQARSFKKRNNH